MDKIISPPPLNPSIIVTFCYMTKDIDVKESLSVQLLHSLLLISIIPYWTIDWNYTRLVTIYHGKLNFHPTASVSVMGSFFL